MGALTNAPRVKPFLGRKKLGWRLVLELLVVLPGF
jgi:hypothetical protein